MLHFGDEDPGHPQLHAMSSHTDRHKGADIASASSITPGTDGDYFAITGTTPVTSIVSRPAGDRFLLRIVNGGLKFTHLTGTLNMRGKLSFTAQSGDLVEFISDGGGEWWECRRSSSEQGLNQAFEVILLAVAAVEPIQLATSTGTGASGVTSTILTAVAPPAPVDATSTGTGTSGVTPITLTAVAPPAPVVAVAVT